MRNAKRVAALTAAVATATAPLLALASPAIAEQSAKPTQPSRTCRWSGSRSTRSAGPSCCSAARPAEQGLVPTALNVTNAASPQYTSLWTKDATRKVNVLQGLSATTCPSASRSSWRPATSPR